MRGRVGGGRRHGGRLRRSGRPPFLVWDCNRIAPSRDYLFVQNTTNTIDYTLREVTNPEYLIQGVSVSQRSNVVVGINGRTASGDETACRRMLAESVEQLKQRHPKLAERVDDLNGRTLHTLSIKRNGCFTIVEVVKPALRVPCASSFLLRCERCPMRS